MVVVGIVFVEFSGVDVDDVVDVVVVGVVVGVVVVVVVVVEVVVGVVVVVVLVVGVLVVVGVVVVGAGSSRWSMTPKPRQAWTVALTPSASSPSAMSSRSSHSQARRNLKLSCLALLAGPRSRYYTRMCSEKHTLAQHTEV